MAKFILYAKQNHQLTRKRMEQLFCHRREDNTCSLGTIQYIASEKLDKINGEIGYFIVFV